VSRRPNRGSTWIDEASQCLLSALQPEHAAVAIPCCASRGLDEQSSTFWLAFSDRGCVALDETRH
jgi:hypothetical protein